MTSVFWDAQGVLLLDYLPKGHTITGEYYSDLLKRLRESIKKKRPGMITKGVLFHQDNAPAHSSMLAMATIRDCGFQLVPHPPYSPDLAPSDFHLFPNLKKDLAGQRYTTDEEVIDAFDSYLEDQPKDFYCSGIEALRHRWKKCVDLQGDNVENRALNYFCILPSLGGSTIFSRPSYFRDISLQFCLLD